MKDYMVFELKAFFNKQKTLFLFITLLSGGFLLFAAIHFQNLGDYESEMYDELNETRLTLRSVENYYRENSEDVILADNVYQQQSLTATMYNGILFEKSSWLYESGKELGNLRLEFAAFSEDDELPETLFPPIHESKRQVVEYSALQEVDADVLIDSRNTSDYLRLMMQYFGMFAFLFLVIFASDIGLEDFNHQTMVEGYPLHPISKMLTQVCIYLGSILATSLFVLLIIIIFISLFWGKTDLSYPIGIYSFGQYQAIPVWQGLLWFLLYYAFLSLHIIIFSLLLNRLLKNMYATLVILIFIYGLSFLFPNLSAKLAWTPLPYYQMTSILEGAISERGYGYAYLQNGMLILLLSAVIVLIIMTISERRKVLKYK